MAWFVVHFSCTFAPDPAAALPRQQSRSERVRAKDERDARKKVRERWDVDVIHRIIKVSE